MPDISDLGGWIKLYRGLLYKPIWEKSTSDQKVILITLLLKANHEQMEWEWEGIKFKVQPGQFVTSLDSLSKLTGVTLRKVRTAISKFERYEFLTNKSTKTGRLITIVNWRLYQGDKSKSDRDVDIEVTEKCQSSDKEVSSNKNDKNDKNEEKKESEYNPKSQIQLKVKYAEHVSMTVQEYGKLVIEFGEELVRDKIDDLNNWKGRKGKETKSDYFTIRAWIKKDSKKEKGGTTDAVSEDRGNFKHFKPFAIHYNEVG